LGRKLLQAFLEQSRNTQCVYLTTDAEANESANRLYREIGFQHSRRFLQRRGRWMNEYVFRHKPANEPVEINE
jgi:ribosomal protein S18 acetylase RimI-like enzyme